MSDELTFHWPASFEMEVWIVNDETGQTAKATIGLGNFKHPTPETIKQHMEGMLAGLTEQGMGGFRLATKREAWKELCIERAGITLAMPGGEDWDEL